MRPRHLIVSVAPLWCGTLPGCGLGESSFQWTVTPDELEMVFGGLATFEVNVEEKANINADVDLSFEAPEGFVVDLPTSMASTQETAEGSSPTPRSPRR